MLPYASRLYNYFEKFQGKRLIALLVAFFIIFLSLGVAIGQIPILFDNRGGETIIVTEGNQKPVEKVVEMSGKVVYSDASLHPNDNISYKLLDSSGKAVILLSATDDKLKVIEGATVKLQGKLSKTADGKEDVLLVDKVIFGK